MIKGSRHTQLPNCERLSTVFMLFLSIVCAHMDAPISRLDILEGEPVMDDPEEPENKVDLEPDPYDKVGELE